MGEQSEEDKAIELWKVKNLIKSLEAARGNGTSMISLILPVSMTGKNNMRLKRLERLEEHESVDIFQLDTFNS